MRRCGQILRSVPQGRYAVLCAPQGRYFSDAAAAPKLDQEKIWTFMASFGLEAHASKFNSWAQLQRIKKHHLVQLGIEKPKQRKMILRQVEGWKQEQRYKLHLLQQAGRADKIEALAEAASRQEYEDYLAAVAESTDNQERHHKDREQALREKADDALAKRIDRISKGLPVQVRRFPAGHPLDGLSETEVAAVHAGYVNDMYKSESGSKLDSKTAVLQDAMTLKYTDIVSIPWDADEHSALIEAQQLMESGAYANYDALKADRPDLAEFMDKKDSKEDDRIAAMTEMLESLDPDIKLTASDVTVGRVLALQSLEDEGFKVDEPLRELINNVSPHDLGVVDESSDDMAELSGSDDFIDEHPADDEDASKLYDAPDGPDDFMDSIR